MTRTAKGIVLTLSVVVFSYVAVGYVLGRTAEDKAYRSLGVFGEVLQHIQQDYVEEPNLAVVTTGALHGLLESLDPYSSYLSPQEYAEYKKQAQNGSKGKIGAFLSKRFGYVLVVSVLAEGPAHKAGLRNGDILEAIAGFTTREMSVGQAELLLAGEPGTHVKVGVVRRGRTEPQEVELTRAELAPQPVLVDRIENEIGYLRVPTLKRGKAEEMREKLAQFERQGVRKLVLDLRGCALGEVSEAVAVARLFLPGGTITTLRGQTVASQTFSVEPGKAVWKHPMTVVISNWTAGPAEVLAGALGSGEAATRRAELVGERTFGAASEQKLIPLEDGAALILTVANYYTPAGKSIPDEGVAPTVEIRGEDFADLGEDESLLPPSESPAAREDTALKKAIEILRGTPRAPAASQNGATTKSEASKTS